MAEIQPFGGIQYRAADLSRVLAPPYDVIPAATRDELYARDPHNIVRVILNRAPGDEGYAEAGGTFRRWQDEGVLQADATPAVYVLEQSFAEGGRTLRRFGLLARFRAEDPERRVILPHEHTRAAAKEDRWRVLIATKANFSPIFLMFPDPGSSFATLVLEAIGQRPVAHFTDDGGVGHRMWRVVDPTLVGRLQALLAGVKSYIADGHHRHATALRYRDAVGPDGAWTLGYFTPIEAPGLVVQPYHRILSEGPSLDEAGRRLPSAFRLTRQSDVAAAVSAVAASPAPYAFALAEPGKGALVVEADPGSERRLSPEAPACLRALDTYFLHHAVLGPLLGVPDTAVSYVHSQAEAEEALAKGACRLAVLLRATPVPQIVDVADAGESMPAKSTFF
ncbi:MAG TPA: DUF1015 domain-containing protein, partial [Vicinamibacteria bacterium]|nr:DUF1015 domain-containing protein [Vicinamibacteria bacterium]